MSTPGLHEKGNLLGIQTGGHKAETLLSFMKEMHILGPYVICSQSAWFRTCQAHSEIVGLIHSPTRNRHILTGMFFPTKYHQVRMKSRPSVLTAKKLTRKLKDNRFSNLNISCPWVYIYFSKKESDKLN